MQLKDHSCRLCLFVCVLVLTSAALNAQNLGGAAAKQNLDLPVNARTDDREDEEAPETVSFYGQLFESEVVVFVVSREGGMQVRGDLDVVKRELVNAISEFSQRMQFGIVFYDRGVEQFRRHVVTATAEIKATAATFIRSIPGGGGSCINEGLMSALRLAILAPATHKAVIYIGTGSGFCQGANQEVYLARALKTTNFVAHAGNIQVNTIGVAQSNLCGAEFLRQVARSNGGTSVHLGTVVRTGGGGD